MALVKIPSSGISGEITYDCACQETNGPFKLKQKQSCAAIVINVSSSTPLTAENMGSVWSHETVKSRDDMERRFL